MSMKRSTTTKKSATLPTTTRHSLIKQLPWQPAGDIAVLPIETERKKTWFYGAWLLTLYCYPSIHPSVG